MTALDKPCTNPMCNHGWVPIDPAGTRKPCPVCHGSGKIASEPKDVAPPPEVARTGRIVWDTPEAQGADRCKLCGDWVNLRNHGIGVCSQPPTEAVTADDPRSSQTPSTRW